MAAQPGRPRWRGVPLGLLLALLVIPRSWAAPVDLVPAPVEPVAPAVAPAVPDLAPEFSASVIAVGAGPAGVAIDTTRHRAYVANTEAGTVSAIDTATDRVVATIQVGARPSGITVDKLAHRAYVANSAAGSVSVIDTTTDTVVATIATATAGLEPQFVAADPRGHRLYVGTRKETDAQGDGLPASHAGVVLWTVDTDTNLVIGALKIGTNPWLQLRGMDVVPVTGSLYLSVCSTNLAECPGALLEVDASTGQPRTAVMLGAGPAGVSVDAGARQAFVAHTAGSGGGPWGGVSLVDLDLAIAGVVTVHAPDLTQTAWDPGARRLFVTDTQSRAVVVLDPDTGEEVARVGIGSLPTGLAVDPATHRVYVTTAAGSVVVLSE